MAQSKVTDYYSLRKSNAAFKSTKRSARHLKLCPNDTIPEKCGKKHVALPETLPIKTAALGSGSLGAGCHLFPVSNVVDLSAQLKSLTSSKSVSNVNILSEAISRTISRTTRRQLQAVTQTVKHSTDITEERQTVLEKTPLKRLASDPDREEPPRRKRTKLNTIEDEKETHRVNNRTPSRSRKSNTATARRRLEVQPPSPTSTKKPNQADVKKGNELSQSSNSNSSTGNFDPSQMKQKLAGCGKLADLQARLALVKGTAADIKKLQQQAIKQKVKTPKETETQEKYEEKPAPVPAFERYRHLIQPGPSALALPFKYRSMEEVFRCSDTVVSMLHNRTETCTFAKLKHGVQEMSRRTFDLGNLKQIKAVYPSAYDMQWVKTLPQHTAERQKKDPYTLVLEANLAGIPSDQPEATEGGSGQNSLVSGLLQRGNSKTRSAMFEKFTPSMLIARRTLFHNGLVDMVKTHHREYLSSLDPPISVPDEKLNRWHPKFPLEQIPEVRPADLVEPPMVTSYNTAKDVLDKARRMMVNPKVTKALELVAKNSELKAAVEAKRAQDGEKRKPVSAPASKSNQALKGISQDLLNRIKAKEAHKSQIAMMRSPEEEKRIGMLERLPELCRILRVFFLAEKKAALPIDVVIQKLMDSYRSALSKEEGEKHVDLMVEVLPDWLKKVNIRKDCYIKINRTKELSIIIDVVNEKLKEAKK